MTGRVESALRSRACGLVLAVVAVSAPRLSGCDEAPGCGFWIDRLLGLPADVTPEARLASSVSLLFFFLVLGVAWKTFGPLLPGGSRRGT